MSSVIKISNDTLKRIESSGDAEAGGMGGVGMVWVRPVGVGVTR